MMSHRGCALIRPMAIAEPVFRPDSMNVRGDNIQRSSISRGATVERFHHLIIGVTTEGTSGNVGPIYNPATGLQVGKVDLASVEETDAAVAAAAAAFPAWRATNYSHSVYGGCF